MVSRVSSVFSWISQHSRPIAVNGSNVTVLYSPQEYYNCLKRQILLAKERIQMSSLYFGTSPKETELISTLSRALGNNPQLQCTVVLDYLRGNRGSPNSLDMFRPLLDRHPHQFHLHMYHTPHLNRRLKKWLPERVNEIIGLQHTKINIFDDTVLLTGANLSNDYFTNRQDRYILFDSSTELANYLSNFHKIISSHSFVMSSRGGVTNPPATPTNDPLSSKRNFRLYKESFQEAIKALIQSETKTTSIGMSPEDTVVYPLVQMGQYNIKQDETVTSQILTNLQQNESIFLSSSYFNLPQIYKDAILTADGSFKILASSPQCNGFYNGEGLSKYVPYMYVHYAAQFFKEIKERKIQYMEYYRPDWTYHGKGLWYYLSGDSFPLLTIIGSGNFGQRSLVRDLECQVVVVTQNYSLQESLHKECVKLYEYGKELSLNEIKSNPQRKFPLWVWLVATLFRSFV